MKCQHADCSQETLNPKFCSLRCSNLTRSPTVKKTYTYKNCKHCGNELVLECKNRINVFCDQSCAAKFNNTLKSSKKKSKANCIGCHIILNQGRKFCSHSCEQDYYINLWLAGKISGNKQYTYRKFVKQYLQLKDGGKCEKCPENRCHPLDGKSILQLNHIDGNWRNTSPDNIELLCPTCHSLTSNYGARNRGNGRSWKPKYDKKKMERNVRFALTPQGRKRCILLTILIPLK